MCRAFCPMGGLVLGSPVPWIAPAGGSARKVRAGAIGRRGGGDASARDTKGACVMRDLFRDPDDVYERIRLRMLSAAPMAMRKLGRIARGLEGCRDDHEHSGCLALARYGSALVNAEANAPPMGLGYHSSNTPERAAALLARLRASDNPRDPVTAKGKGDVRDDENIEQRAPTLGALPIWLLELVWTLPSWILELPRRAALRCFEQQAGLAAPFELAVGLDRDVAALEHRLERGGAGVGAVDEEAELRHLVRVDRQLRD